MLSRGENGENGEQNPAASLPDTSSFTNATDKLTAACFWLVRARGRTTNALGWSIRVSVSAT